MAIIYFKRDWSIRVDGSLRDGCLIHYEGARLPNCRSSYHYGNWNIRAMAKLFPGGVLTLEKTLQLDLELPGEILFASFDLPLNTQRVEFWFVNSDPTGCVAYDSNYGQNYSFLMS